MRYRTGIGYDVHRLSEGTPLVLGGIRIPSDKGPEGHSDGDVLIHAICDALLGAAALGDIGMHFPDTDPVFRGIDSRVLLERSSEKVREAGYSIANIDSTVCLQRPLLRPHIPRMTRELSSVLQIGEDMVSVKATTTEGLGFTGDGSGISAYAVALLYRE